MARVAILLENGLGGLSKGQSLNYAQPIMLRLLLITIS